MDSAVGLQASPWRGCPIRTSPDHSLLATPRGFSQPSTSFIGSWCQGIHRAPLLARRLDLSTSPSRQDQRSQKDLNQKENYLVLLNYSSVLQVQNTKNGPTSVEPLVGHRKSSRRLMRLATPVYGWSVTPSVSRGTRLREPAKSHYIVLAFARASGWSRGDSNP